MQAVAIESITIEPSLSRWTSLPGGDDRGRSHDHDHASLAELTRRELGLPIDRPILATGHQPSFWHPGILAKYIAVNCVLRSAAGRVEQWSGLNVIVDQDVVDFASVDVPARGPDGSLIARRIAFAPVDSAADVPVGRLPAITPALPEVADLAELPELTVGVRRMQQTMAHNRAQPTAAAQVASALTELMVEFGDLAPLPTIMASDLMRTTLARTLISAMVSDAHRCAAAYNRAVAAHPAARVTPLAIRDDYVELPLWRLREDGPPQRVRAYDADAERWLSDADPARPTLLPRALCMTALLRMAVCDLFVHGAGGAVYDRVMEQWIAEWNGWPLRPIAMTSATLRLPLMSERDHRLLVDDGLKLARRRLRSLEHDPESADGELLHRPGPIKQRMLREIDGHSPGSRQRRAAFFAMHQELTSMRAARAAAMTLAAQETERISLLARDATVAQRRDWAFPLYPRKMLSELVSRIRDQAGR